MFKILPIIDSGDCGTVGGVVASPGIITEKEM